MVVALGAGGGVVAAALIALVRGDAGLFPALAIFFSVSAGVVNSLFGWFLAKAAARKASPPVQVEHYLPQKGTIALRFRHPEYAEQLLQAMQLAGEPEAH